MAVMKRSAKPNLPPLLSAPSPAAAAAAAAATDNPRRRPTLRRRVRSPAFLSGRRVAAAARAGGGGRRSGPATPLLRWKFDEDGAVATTAAASAPVTENVGPEKAEKKARRKQKNAGAGGAGGGTLVSARKLASGIWQLQLPEASGGAGRAAGTSGFEPVAGHLRTPHLYSLKGTAGYRKDCDDKFPSPASATRRKNGLLMLEPSTVLPNHAMERATKWDPGFSKASEDVYRFYGHMKFLEDQQVTAVSVVSSLRAELEQAWSRVNELEDERRSSKKKLDRFLSKFAEEKESWKRREHEKVRAVIDTIKDELNREKKNRQRMEIVNSKLVHELKEAKLSAKRYMQDYEKERKNRELMEEVCDELAKEIGEEKAEVEALKRESLKMREEVEEERRMLQMAEVWREERVQMKLVDAKLALEEKYMQLCNLQAHLEAFLNEVNGASPSMGHIKEAELLIEAVNSVNIQEVKEFTYQPPRASEDIFSVFEELQPAEETQEREIEACYAYTPPASRASMIHTVSPDINTLNENPLMKYATGTPERDGDMEDDSGWETVSRVEDQGSANSPDGSDPSINGAYLESNASASGTDFEGAAENRKSSSEISEVSSTTKQSRKKTSAIARLWRSSCPNNGEVYKIATIEPANGKLSNGRKSNVTNGTLSPDRVCGETGLSSPSVGQWSSPDSKNPHITRGMKGCIEWPRGMQKHSLKEKLLEARMESQKIQLRQVLKQRS